MLKDRMIFKPLSMHVPVESFKLIVTLIGLIRSVCLAPVKATVMEFGHHFVSKLSSLLVILGLYAVALEPHLAVAQQASLSAA